MTLSTTMKLHPEDPRLTAYLLGELSPDDAAAVELAAASDPMVQTALNATYKVQCVLMGALAPNSTTLLPRQRENIRRAFRGSANAGEIVPFPIQKKSLAPYLMPLGIAAAVALVSWIAFHQPAASPAPLVTTSAPDSPATTGSEKSLPFAVAILPAPGPKIPNSTAVAPTKSQLTLNVKALDAALQDSSGEMYSRLERQLASGPLPDAASLPELVSRGAVSTADAHELPLPVMAGSGSLGWIYKSVKEQGLRPDTKIVRLEEILNAFDLRPNGTAAIAKGASLAAESFACPWKPSATLLMIHFQGAINGSRQVEAALNVDPTAVSSFRLLGFSPIRGIENGTLPTSLPAKTGTTLLIEIEPRASATNLGEIRWKVEGSDAAPVPVTRKPDAEPSDDARFASLLASYALWLTKDEADSIDTELVSGLARECAASDLPITRRELLVLVAKTMEL